MLLPGLVQDLLDDGDAGGRAVKLLLFVGADLVALLPDPQVFGGQRLKKHDL